jgi:hypothetical protein
MKQYWGHSEYNRAFSLTLQCSYINTTTPLSLHLHYYDTFTGPTQLRQFHNTYATATLLLQLSIANTSDRCYYPCVMGLLLILRIKGTPVPAPLFLTYVRSSHRLTCLFMNSSNSSALQFILNRRYVKRN